ncbi:M23/M56 family metallopeptidase [Pseudoduganella chitinolytica]|uniref:M23/M56 family metallopeptidase n=1 Tax=Pseudoduganella chitinolytica TaxID=34070 RepID=A0ABY8B712_9BURK|nr:M23/M56 family metallopeptidase [Pseudoduganella chitinolytica]WEF31722.1 M23/M56 family metallopeptidase [Pseudoduganella chitinolytica]
MNAHAIHFLLACVSTLVTATVAWAVLWAALRRWPALAERRAPWLLALLTGALTLVLVLLPVASQYSLVPATVTLPVASAAPVTPSADLTGSDDLEEASILPWCAWFWLGCYTAGVAWHARRWQQGRHLVRSLLQAGDTLDGAALAAHPAFAGQACAVPVLEVDAPIAPMLAGLRHPVLLLPRHLRSFAVDQQRLIVAHELAHLRRHDHWWQHAGALLQALLWFVPAAHALRRRLHWALELGCDRAVLAGRPASARRSYATALLAQLQILHRQLVGPVPAALQFGSAGPTVAERVHLIRTGGRAAPLPVVVAIALLLPALCAAGVLLQPRVATVDGGAAAPASAPPSLAEVPQWQAPLAQLRVTSEFGATNRPSGQPHRGMDFGAARGSAVLAPAGGIVTVSTDRYEGGARYGKVIVIDHGDGTQTLYAHLDARAVQAGDRVTAGQRIALSGATGKVTGPHLHFEVQRGGGQVDPRTLLRTALPPR